MTITVDAKKVTKMLLQYPKVHAKATSIAMNRGLSAGATESLRVAKKEWGGLLVSDFKRYTWRTTAKANDPKVQFAITSRSINLIDFVKKDNKKGLSYKLKGRQRQMKGSFRAKGFFFTRDKGGTRNDITPHFSVTPTSMFRIARGEAVFVTSFFRGRGGKFAGFGKEYFSQLNRLLPK